MPALSINTFEASRHFGMLDASPLDANSAIRFENRYPPRAGRNSQLQAGRFLGPAFPGAPESQMPTPGFPSAADNGELRVILDQVLQEKWAKESSCLEAASFFRAAAISVFKADLLSCIEGRSVQHAEVARGFKVLIESAGNKILDVEFLASFSVEFSAINRGKWKFDGTGRLESGIGFFPVAFGVPADRSAAGRMRGSV